MCSKNDSGDCWITYKNVAGALFDDEVIKNMPWSHGAVTGHIREQGYFANPKGKVVNYNSNRTQNYGFDTTPTEAIRQLIGSGEGTFVFAVQVARQFHNVTVIATKTGNSITFQGFDQGTGWFQVTPQIYTEAKMNETFKDISDGRIAYHKGAGAGEELHARIFMYSSGRARTVMQKSP